MVVRIVPDVDRTVRTESASAWKTAERVYARTESGRDSYRNRMLFLRARPAIDRIDGSRVVPWARIEAR